MCISGFCRHCPTGPVHAASERWRGSGSSKDIWEWHATFFFLDDEGCGCAVRSDDLVLVCLSLLVLSQPFCVGVRSRGCHPTLRSVVWADGPKTGLTHRLILGLLYTTAASYMSFSWKTKTSVLSWGGKRRGSVLMVRRSAKHLLLLVITGSTGIVLRWEMESCIADLTGRMVVVDICNSLFLKKMRKKVLMQMHDSPGWPPWQEEDPWEDPPAFLLVWCSGRFRQLGHELWQLWSCQAATQGI